jgi:branched-chain amino acid transport system ATP-binding protein
VSAILEARGVTKRFGGLVAVGNLDFEMEQGSIASVIGPNGAGKTTFFNCISGFFQIDEGRITFEGTEVHRLRPDQISHLGISRTYQNTRLFPTMTALENILIGEHQHLRATWLGAVIGTRSQREEEVRALEEARRLLTFVGLRGQGDMLAAKLPYGDQRRLEVARALAGKPRLLLLDEPTAGMNPSETLAMTEFIRRLRGELGISILLIEHEMRVVMGISDRITVLDYGQKIAEGTPREIQGNARVIEAYLGRAASIVAATVTATAPDAPPPDAPPPGPAVPTGAG